MCSFKVRICLKDEPKLHIFFEKSKYLSLFLHTNVQLRCQPLAHRFIIEFQGYISEGYVGRIDASHPLPSLAQSVKLVLDEPCVEEVHNRIMHDVERIREVAQELADACRSLVGCHTRCTEPNKRREDEHDAAHLENSVHADATYTREERH